MLRGKSEAEVMVDQKAEDNQRPQHTEDLNINKETI